MLQNFPLIVLENYNGPFFLSIGHGAKKEVTISGKFSANTGDVIETRTGGSWKNDYRYWYVVDKTGNMHKVAEIDNSREKSLVMKYLSNEIGLDELIAKTPQHGVKDSRAPW